MQLITQSLIVRITAELDLSLADECANVSLDFPDVIDWLRIGRRILKLLLLRGTSMHLSVGWLWSCLSQLAIISDTRRNGHKRYLLIIAILLRQTLTWRRCETIHIIRRRGCIPVIRLHMHRGWHRSVALQKHSLSFDQSILDRPDRLRREDRARIHGARDLFLPCLEHAVHASSRSGINQGVCVHESAV